MKNKYPIPIWCKEDCKFRDKKTEQMPACFFPSRLDVNTEKNICNSYRKELQ